MVTLMPLSDANFHICLSHHGRVVMLLKKRCLPNHKCCGLGFYSSCYILFLTCKSPKSQSPHEVLAESPRSPQGVPRESSGIIGSSQGIPSNMWGSVTYTIPLDYDCDIYVFAYSKFAITKAQQTYYLDVFCLFKTCKCRISHNHMCNVCMYSYLL